ncbi:hypothetical protein B0T16DRAFT_453240 [Cercophora newfieldiana]|uniref:Uncharacterized protein n=1 Tax=Cercophora newfieldiana TaxID=92897 RepID=A0AA39YSK0_9PEZI|nr:hypothetical protein B0T16DRAFT_453240 [Cercophora newfieldiana]
MSDRNFEQYPYDDDQQVYVEEPQYNVDEAQYADGQEQQQYEAWLASQYQQSDYQQEQQQDEPYGGYYEAPNPYVEENHNGANGTGYDEGWAATPGWGSDNSGGVNGGDDGSAGAGFYPPNPPEPQDEAGTEGPYIYPFEFYHVGYYGGDY